MAASLIFSRELRRRRGIGRQRRVGGHGGGQAGSTSECEAVARPARQATRGREARRAGHHRHDVELGHHDDELAVVADGHVGVAARHHPELAAVAQVLCPGLAHVDVGLAHALDPRRRQDLLSFPHAAAQVEIADLRHVARMHVEAGAAARDALRVGPPQHVLDAERPEQHLARIVERALAGDLGQDGRQQMAVAAVVVEARARRLRHRLDRGRTAASRDCVPWRGRTESRPGPPTIQDPMSCRAGGGS